MSDCRICRYALDTARGLWCERHLRRAAVACGDFEREPGADGRDESLREAMAIQAQGFAKDVQRMISDHELALIRREQLRTINQSVLMQMRPASLAVRPVESMLYRAPAKGDADASGAVSADGADV